MKIRYVTLETTFPVPEVWGNTDRQAITRARGLLRERLEHNPESLIFSVETSEMTEEEYKEQTGGLPVTKHPAVRQVPAVWMHKFGVEVIDPDGWDRTNPNWASIPLSMDQFIEKYQRSTCRVVDREKYKVWKHLFQ